jgi:hypothetical protein
MRNRRPIFASAILALGVAGTILSSSAMASAAVQAPSTHATGGPYIFYHS